MHRDIRITVPSAATSGLVTSLTDVEGVVSLSVERQISVKPPGDVLTLSVLNHATDEVIECLLDAAPEGSMSVATSDLSSLHDRDAADLIKADVDEASWEDAETGLRHHSRPTANFFAANLLAGVIAACGMLASNLVTEATLLVGAAIIAVLFEPLARLSLGAVIRQRTVVWEGLRAVAFAYVTVILGALITVGCFRVAAVHFGTDFQLNEVTHDLESFPSTDLIASAAAALAGVYLVAAGRFAQLAGPLIALQLLPAAVAVGGSLVLGDGLDAGRACRILVIDLAMVVAAGLIIFTVKRVRVHGTRPALR